MSMLPLSELNAMYDAEQNPVAYDTQPSPYELDVNTDLSGSIADMPQLSVPPPAASGQMPPLDLVAQQGSDVAGRYQQYLQMFQQAYAPQRAPEIVETPFDSPLKILAGVIGMGIPFADMAGRYAARRRATEQYNAKLDMKATEDAFKLTQMSTNAESQQNRVQISLANLQARVTQMGLQNQTRAIRDQIAQRKAAMGELIKGPLSLAQQDALAESGRAVQESPDYPGYFRMVPMGGPAPAPGGGFAPPAPGSPVGRILDPRVAAPSQPTQAASPVPGGAGGAITAGGGREARITREAAAKELGKVEAGRKTIGDPTIKMIDKMIAATDALPSGKSLRAVIGSYSGASGVANRLKLKQESGPGIDRVRDLASGNLLVQQLFRLVAVGVATEKDVAPFKQRLEGLEGQTREEARNNLAAIRDFVTRRLGMDSAPTGDVNPSGAAPTGAQAETPKPAASSDGWAITPGGVRYRPIQ